VFSTFTLRAIDSKTSAERVVTVLCALPGATRAMQDDKKELPNLPPSDAPSWRQLAERASKEPDPTKLVQLVQELCDQLEQAEQQKKNLLQKGGVK
jgi:hypothetical protein